MPILWQIDLICQFDVMSLRGYLTYVNGKQKTQVLYNVCVRACVHCSLLDFKLIT